jgi:F-type H+-transporting ATPase subunit delta
MRNTKGRFMARSLLAVAKQVDAVENVLHSLNWMESLLKTDARFRAFLQSKKIDSDQKKEVIRNSLSGQCHEIVIEFLVITVENRTLQTIRDVCIACQNLAKEELGIVSVRAEVAEAVNESETVLLKSRLDTILGKNSDLTIDVNPDLIGGIKLRVENTYLDASLQQQLKRMRDTIVTS